MLRHIEDEEYRNIINTLKGMPAVTMTCDMKGKSAVLSISAMSQSGHGVCLRIHKNSSCPLLIFLKMFIATLLP